jgi:hypothetical protein
MRSFLSVCRSESNNQPILVHINADHLLRNQAATVRVRAVGTWLALPGRKMLILAGEPIGSPQIRLACNIPKAGRPKRPADQPAPRMAA